MNISIKIDKRLINDADIDTDAFALGCLQAIHEESGMYLDKKSIKLNEGKFANTANMVFTKENLNNQSNLIENTKALEND